MEQPIKNSLFPNQVLALPEQPSASPFQRTDTAPAPAGSGFVAVASVLPQSRSFGVRGAAGSVTARPEMGLTPAEEQDLALDGAEIRAAHDPMVAAMFDKFRQELVAHVANRLPAAAKDLLTKGDASQAFHMARALLNRKLV